MSRKKKLFPNKLPYKHLLTYMSFPYYYLTKTNHLILIKFTNQTKRNCKTEHKKLSTYAVRLTNIQ